MIKITINDGYWVNVVHNWLYIAKYGAKSVNLTHGSHIEQEHSLQRRRRELAAIKLFSPNDLVYTDCY